MVNMGFCELGCSHSSQSAGHWVVPLKSFQKTHLRRLTATLLELGHKNLHAELLWGSSHPNFTETRWKYMLEQTRWGLCSKRKKNRNCDLQTNYRATVKVVFTINKLQMGHRHFHVDHLLGLPHLLSLRTLGRCNARMLAPQGEVAFASLLWRRSGLAALRCSKGDGGTAVGEQRGNPITEMSTPHWSEYLLCANVSPLPPGRPTRLPWVWGCRGS